MTALSLQEQGPWRILSTSVVSHRQAEGGDRHRTQDRRSVLQYARSGFHAWLNRSPSARSRHDEVLVTAIDRSFKSSDRTYGARRVWHDMLAEGLSCGLHRIERLMRQNGLRARPRRRGLPKDTGERAAVSDNLLDRAFEAAAPNQKWIADFTYVW